MSYLAASFWVIFSGISKWKDTFDSRCILSTSLIQFGDNLLISYFFKNLICLLSCFSHVRLFGTLWTVACQSPLSRDFPGKNTIPLQRIFQTHGSDPHVLLLLHWQWWAGSLPLVPTGLCNILYPLRYIPEENSL